ALAGLAGCAGGVRSSLDQYVALIQSTTVADRMIDQFKLMEVYDETLRMDARKQFWKNLRVTAGRRAGLSTIEVDDHDPQRAADMARAMVEQFRRMASEIAVTEAQQRRVFFEKRVEEVQRRLEEAQQALTSSGFAANLLKAEPKAAAESYAKMRAELTTAQARLQGLRSTFSPQAAEVRQQASLVAELQAQLRDLESRQDAPKADEAAYLSRYREFKYQEALFEQFSRQLELARVDEGREGGILQVVDVAQLPERKSKPKRAFVGIGVSVLVGFLMLAGVLARFHVRHNDPGGHQRRLLRDLGPAVLRGRSG
ncbi:MAG: lipopolysaccharide biosynthesis protein, partial [Inhella sp.]